jgi:hypothetical protein
MPRLSATEENTMTTTITPATEAVTKLLQDPHFISVLTQHFERVMADSENSSYADDYDPEVVAQIQQASDDYDNGRVKGKPWRELRERRLDALQSRDVAVG